MTLKMILLGMGVKERKFLAFLGAFTALIAVSAAPSFAQEPCVADREALLALDFQAFDQDLEGGWRPIAKTQGCYNAAADLIAAHRERHGPYEQNWQRRISAFHEAQIRACDGQTERPIALASQSYHDIDEDDPRAAVEAMWNAYVDATIAFIADDKPALRAAHDALAALEWPPEHKEENQAAGLDVSQPMNMEIVEGMVRDFDLGYPASRQCIGEDSD